MAGSGRKFMLFWDITTSQTRYCWRLRGGKGESVAWSERGYISKPQCEANMESVKMKYPDASVVDLTIVRS